MFTVAATRYEPTPDSPELLRSGDSQPITEQSCFMDVRLFYPENVSVDPVKL